MNKLVTTINYQLSNLTVYKKLRLEKRFLNDLDENITLNRIRYQFGNSIALNKFLFIVLSDEIFANLQDKVLAENCLYAGVGIQILEANNIQFGYVNQKINGIDVNRLQVALYIKTNHLKT
ncbi:MAG: DUF2490 domain-containing protein [Flavobacteriales bacterium]|nr:DUF2490 domain-containing protein [Flavobacteriales bacterium]